MNFDDIRAVWTAETGGDPTMTDEELIHTVVAQDRTLNRHLRLRDFMELGVAIVLVALFSWQALEASVAWPWWAAVAMTSGVAAVFVRERVRQVVRPRAEASLRDGLRQALAEADRQIALLRSVMWWYLLPLAVAVAFVFLGVALERDAAGTGPGAAWLVAVVLVMLALVGPLYWYLWWLNQQVVQDRLRPHRDRLAAALSHLDDGEDTGDA